MVNGSAAAALAAVSVLLSLATTPCAVAGRSGVGRTHLRGGSTAPKTPEKRSNYSGKRIRGGGDGGRKLQLQATSAPAATSAPPARAAPVGTSPPAAASAPAAISPPAPPEEPQCTTLFVPDMAAPLKGYYTFKGRFNNGHPVYADSVTGNKIFYKSSHFYITQPLDSGAVLFLSLETDVFEPTLLQGLQPWGRNNDPACQGQEACTWNIRISCTTLTADAATATPPPTAAAVAAAMENTNSTSSAEEVTTTAAPVATAAPATAAPSASTIATSAIDGCMSLSIKNGADKAGVYVLDTNSAGDAVLTSGRPSYTGVGVNHTDDRVFTVMMDACAAGYGVVDAAWPAEVGDLTLNASSHAVFLMYVAENGGPGLAGTAVNCEVPVWFVTSDGSSSTAADLDTAAVNTFLSLSGVEDPSEAVSWAKLTPATATSRATLVDNSWINVGCADAAEVEEALGTGAGEGAGAGAGGEGETDEPPVTPVGSEPNGRRLRGSLF